MSRSRVARVGRLAALLLFSACDGAPTPPTSSLAVDVTGRLERGSTIVLAATLDGSRLAPEQVQWSADPAASVELLPDGRARLLEAGRVVLSAQAAGTRTTQSLEVAAPPAIVFDMMRDGNRDIYRVALDGRDLARLTVHPGDDRRPTAAGGTIVFTSYRDGNAELYSIAAAGGAERRLTSTAANETEATLSRDGQRLAFVSDASGMGRIRIASADATGPRAVTQGLGFGGSIESTPTWAPDGQRLAFMATAAGRADLYVVPAGGGIPEALAPATAADVEPAWSLDGRWIAFASTRGGGQTDLYMVHVDTREVRRLTHRAEPDAQPTWLPDGRLVYTAWVDGSARLRWLDPAQPSEVYEIPTGAGTPMNPAAIR
jgi:dipeptidyl aminopeptidase/acylaminoacyl peptidase